MVKLSPFTFELEAADQVKAVPLMLAFKGIDRVPPLQIDPVAGIFKVGRGKTTTLNCCNGPGQPLNVGVIE